MRTKELVATIGDQITRHLSPNKAVGIIWYGSSCHTSKFKDIDIYILLKKHTFLAHDQLRPLIADYQSRGITLSLFVDGEDRICRRGINNFQFGRHGVYFIEILAHGILLTGSNPFVAWKRKIQKRRLQSALTYRIEEYFYRAEKLVKSPIRQAEAYRKVRDLLTRIVIDMALHDGATTFAAVAVSSHLKIISNLITCRYPRLSAASRAGLKKVATRPASWKAIIKLLDLLYQDYLTMYQRPP